MQGKFFIRPLLAAMLTVGTLSIANFANANISVHQSTDGIVATVNDDIILKSELIAASQALAAEYQANKLHVSPAQIQLTALDQLVIRKLQLAMIRRAGVSTNENIINQQMLQIAKSQGLDSLAQLQAKLDGQQQGSYAALRNQLIEDAAIGALWQHQISSRINISEQEAEAFLNSPEAAAIKNIQMIVPEWQTSHILARIDSSQNAAMAEQKINAIYRELQNGASFAELAATYSDDTGSASQRGSLGWVSEGQMVSEFETMMKNTTAGDYSVPFRSQFGWHILKVDQTRQRDITDQYRKNLAREMLFERIAPQAQEDWVQEIKAAAHIEIFE